MPRISEIDVEKAPQHVKDVIEDHVSRGYRITSMKRTMLHNVVAFQSLEESSYALDLELQKLIGKRAGDFFEYAISIENDCLVCTSYFSSLLKNNGIDYETFTFTDRENLLIEYGRAMANDPKNISDDLFARMKQEFTEEEIIVITTMGALMIATNYVNDVLQILPDPPVK